MKLPLPSSSVISNSKFSMVNWIRHRRVVVALALLGLIGLFIFMQIFQRFIGVKEDASFVNPQPTSTQESRWRRLADMPTARGGLAVVVYDNKIYAIGGEGIGGITGVMEVYDPKTNIWSGLPPKPNPVTDIQAVLIAGKFFIPGGKSQSGNPVDTLDIYNPLAETWETGVVMPEALSAYSLVSFDGKLYIFGGWNGKEYSEKVFQFDPSNNQWTVMPPLPSRRGYAGAVVTGRQIILFGGYNGQEALDDLVIIKPDFFQETSFETPYSVSNVTLSSPRYALGISIIADMVFLLGGKGSRNINNAFIYIPDTNEWQLLQPPPIEAIGHMGLVSLGSELISIGGFSPSLPSNEVYAYKAIYTLNIPIIPDNNLEK